MADETRLDAPRSLGRAWFRRGALTVRHLQLKNMLLLLLVLPLGLPTISPIRTPSTTSSMVAGTDSKEFAIKHHRRVIENAHAKAESATSFDWSNGEVGLMLLSNAFGHIVVAERVAQELGLHPPSELLAFSLEGVAWGTVGALGIGAIEWWRCVDERGREPYFPRCSALTCPILVGMMPITLYSAVAFSDRGAGERALHSLRAEAHAQPLFALTLAAGGAIIASCWAHAVLQAALGQLVQTVPIKDTAYAVADVAMTALFTAKAETVASELLHLEAQAQTEAAALALAHARQRSLTVFAYEVPPEEAQRRARAFEDETTRWEVRRADAVRRDRVANMGRALVAAAVFEASGASSLAAPVTASLGVIAAGHAPKRCARATRR